MWSDRTVTSQLAECLYVGVRNRVRVRVRVRDRFGDGVRDRMLGFGELGRNRSNCDITPRRKVIIIRVWEGGGRRPVGVRVVGALMLRRWSSDSSTDHQRSRASYDVTAPASQPMARPGTE